MEKHFSKMETQLGNWRRKIDRLTGAVHGIGHQREFGALVYIDELKALHAMARFRFDEFQAADPDQRQHLETELKSAWADLEAAIEGLDP